MDGRMGEWVDGREKEREKEGRKEGRKEDEVWRRGEDHEIFVNRKSEEDRAGKVDLTPVKEAIPLRRTSAGKDNVSRDP